MSTIDGNNDQRGGDSEEITSNKEECISCGQNNVDDITEGIDSMGVSDMSTCAACGKEGNSDDMNTCNKCKMVKYCNAACKKKHRKKHKKACEKRVAELHDEALFKSVVECKECPICLLTLPLDADESTIHSCCGKRICIGCEYAMKMSEGKDLCAFCRTPPASSDEEEIERTKNLMDKGNAEAFNYFSGYYIRGMNGMPQDYQKARELWLKAGEHGCAEGYYNLGVVHEHGNGVDIDMKKAKYYWELAAMNLYEWKVQSRRLLGSIEGQAGNDHRAFKHYTIAARAGDKGCLDVIKKAFEFKDGLMRLRGIVTKDEYAKTLRGYQKAQDDMKSDMRDKAATLDIIL